VKRRLAVSFGVSLIVKAGEFRPHALIPDHDKRAEKAEASQVAASAKTAADPRAHGG
jgi:hypothetical protein